MASEMCPKCGKLQNVKETVSSRKVNSVDGKTRSVETRSFHCEACGSFVRSEDTETQA